jgi:hypothetical protein
LFWNRFRFIKEGYQYSLILESQFQNVPSCPIGNPNPISIFFENTPLEEFAGNRLKLAPMAASLLSRFHDGNKIGGPAPLTGAYDILP